MSENKEDDFSQKRIKLSYVYPDELKSHFITNVVIQHQPDYFILSFFESWPPPILGETEEERRKLIESIDHIDVKCVSRLVVTPDKMRDIIRVFTENLEKYDKRDKENEL